jgi:DNA-binding transcriptional LysR family regulator
MDCTATGTGIQMELRSLRYFLAVVDAGSVTAAAAALQIAQPSLSRQLAGFEAELGVALFNRRKGRLVLAPAGEQFLPLARDLVNRAAAVRGAASALAAGRLDRIRIAAPATTLTDVIAPFIATIGADDPFPALLEEAPSRVYDALQTRADLAISTEQPPIELASLTLAVLPIWAFVPGTHRFADRAGVSLDELAGGDDTVLILPANYKPRQVLDAALAQAGLALTRSAEVTSPQLAQALAAAGRGVAVVSDDARFDLHGLRIHTDTGPLTLQLHAAWNSGHHAASTIAALALRLRAYCERRYGPEVSPDR